MKFTTAYHTCHKAKKVLRMSAWNNFSIKSKLTMLSDGNTCAEEKEVFASIILEIGSVQKIALMFMMFVYD